MNQPEWARTGLVGMQLVDEDGVAQRTCGRALTPWRVFTQLTGLGQWSPTLFTSIRMTGWDHGETRLVDFASGASLMVRRSVFERLGGFDPRFVVYLEDADFSARARETRWDTRFLAGDPVVHRNGWAAGGDRPWRLAQSWRSLWRYGRKHFRWPGALAVGLMVTVVGPVTRLARAVLHGSIRDGWDTLLGYFTLWRLLLTEHSRTHSVGPSGLTSLRPESASETRAPSGGARES